MVQGVLFDMDGLMFDTESVYTIYWQEMVKEKGYPPLDSDMLNKLRGATPEQHRSNLFKWYGADAETSNDIIFGCYERVAKHLVTHDIAEKAGLRALLDALRKKGIPAALATGTHRDRTEAILAKTGLREHFSGIVCGDEVTLGKPNPEIFLRAAATLGLSPENCIVLEDSFNGIRAAHAAGAQPVMVPDLAQPTEEIRALCAHVFETLDEVIALL